MTITLTPQTQISVPSVATIGFFDGFHRGHQFLIESLKQKAKELNLSTMAITFDVHPRQVLTPNDPPRLLTSAEERIAMLQGSGIDTVVVLPFSSEMSRMTSKEFIHSVMTRIGIRHLLLGYDNHFGSDRTADFSDYVASGREVGIRVERAEPFLVDNEAVSSSRIRRLLDKGMVDAARENLGRPYAVAGLVENGYHEGRQIGFPTANIRVDATKMLPHRGSYATLATIAGSCEMLPAMTNIGLRPTFGCHHLTIETHLIGFEGDIYGHELSLQFISHLREEQQFASVEELRQQLELDRTTALSLLKSYETHYK